MATKNTKSRRTDDQWEGVDAADAEDSGAGGGLLPPAWYRVVIDKAYFREATSSKLEYVNLELQIVDGEYEGRYLFCAMYINSKADNFRLGQKAFLAKFYEVCTGEKPDRFPATDDDLSDLVGTECEVKAMVEDNADAQGNKIQQNRVVRVRDVNSKEDDDKGRKGSKRPRDNDDDDDKRNTKRRTRDDDDDDERDTRSSSKRKRGDEDDDDDDNKRSSKRGRDDDDDDDDDTPPRRSAKDTREAERVAPRDKSSTRSRDDAARGAKGKKGAGAFADMDDDIPF